jgi:hypothetical protein
LINKEGIYTVHADVMEEIRDRTPSPVFKDKMEGKPDTIFQDLSSMNMNMNSLKQQKLTMPNYNQARSST